MFGALKGIYYQARMAMTSSPALKKYYADRINEIFGASEAVRGSGDVEGRISRKSQRHIRDVPGGGFEASQELIDETIKGAKNSLLNEGLERDGRQN